MAKNKRKNVSLEFPINHLLLSLIIVLVSLSIGILGYHCIEGLPWIDSLLNASMILGGMGPVDKLSTEGGKIFASCYALFSGIMILVTVGIIIAPSIHKLLHAIHLEDEKERG